MSMPTEDLIAMHQLYARYNHAIDDGDGAAFAACFTADGALDGGLGDPIRGSEALEGFAVAVPKGMPGIRHQVSNIFVDGDGDDASGRAYLYVYTPGAGGPQVVTTGRYVDTLRRVDGEWRFVFRQFTADTPPPSSH
jgi:uncharacterized protein (TIGR02246 family)